MWLIYLLSNDLGQNAFVFKLLSKTAHRNTSVYLDKPPKVISKDIWDLLYSCEVFTGCRIKRKFHSVWLLSDSHLSSFLPLHGMPLSIYSLIEQTISFFFLLLLYTFSHYRTWSGNYRQYMEEPDLSTLSAFTGFIFLCLVFCFFPHHDYSQQAFSSATLFFYTFILSLYSKSSSISASFLILPCF